MSTAQNKRLPVGFESNARGKKEKDVGFYVLEVGKSGGASPGYRLLDARGGSCSAVNSPTAPARCRPLISCIHLQALDNHGPGLRFLMETGGQQREEVTFPKGLFQPQGLTQPASSPPRWRGTGSSRGMSSTKILTMLLSVVSGDTHTPPKGKSEQKPT